VIGHDMGSPNGAIIPEDLPRAPSLGTFRVDINGGRSSLGHPSCTLVVVAAGSTSTFSPADLFPTDIVVVFLALV